MPAALAAGVALPELAAAPAEGRVRRGELLHALRARAPGRAVPGGREAAPLRAALHRARVRGPLRDGRHARLAGDPHPNPHPSPLTLTPHPSPLTLSLFLGGILYLLLATTRPWYYTLAGVLRPPPRRPAQGQPARCAPALGARPARREPGQEAGGARARSAARAGGGGGAGAGGAHAAAPPLRRRAAQGLSPHPSLTPTPTLALT